MTADINGSNSDEISVCQQVNSCQDIGYLDWSPDGKKLVFSAKTNGQWEIVIVDVVTKQHIILQTPESEIDPDWSPDGTRLAYTLTADESTKTIYIMNVDGTNKVQLTTGYQPD